MRIRVIKKGIQAVLFDPDSGFLATDDEYDYRSGPVFLDVSLTNYCTLCCPYCYRHSNPAGSHMSEDDFHLLLREAKRCGVVEIAYGGGNPNQHPLFPQFLKETFEAGIIPTYSTNGIGLSPQILRASEKYCGAIAISYHENGTIVEKVIQQISKYHVKINMHVILSKKSVPFVISLLRDPPDWLHQINAVVFLSYKPAIGDYDNCLKNSDKLDELGAAISSIDFCKVGFDSCSYPFVKQNLHFDRDSFESCEGGRKSAFISETLDVFPCSFYCGRSVSGGNLHQESLVTIVNESSLFSSHRKTKWSERSCPLFDL